MTYRRKLLLAGLLVFLPVAGQVWPGEVSEPSPEGATSPEGTVAVRMARSIEDPALRELLEEVLERNPAILAAQAGARAAVRRAPQKKGLPDPTLSITAYLEPPQTRTGPQRYVANISQALPWSGRLNQQEQAALFSAAAAEADVDAMRLRLLTETRRLYHEIAYLDHYRRISEEFRSHLVQHEELSRSRYATGVGLGQGVVKIQTEVTRVDKELLDIEARRLSLLARLNGLRDRPGSTVMEAPLLPDVEEVRLDSAALFAAALRLRPELAAAAAQVSQAEAQVSVAEKTGRPGFVIGLTYAGVDRRDDMAGRLQPPEGNGDDIFGIQGGISIPIWRQKLGAGVEAALELEVAAEAARHDEIVKIEVAIGDLAQRLPLSWRQLRLVEDVMIVQAEEAVELARGGYIAGTLNALDLLDAEHVLFEAYAAVARAKTDYLVGMADLEGAVGGPIADIAQDVELAES